MGSTPAYCSAQSDGPLSRKLMLLSASATARTSHGSPFTKDPAISSFMLRTCAIHWCQIGSREDDCERQESLNRHSCHPSGWPLPEAGASGRLRTKGQQRGFSEFDTKGIFTNHPIFSHHGLTPRCLRDPGRFTICRQNFSDFLCPSGSDETAVSSNQQIVFRTASPNSPRARADPSAHSRSAPR